MQSLDGGASGSNGRHSQNRPDGTRPMSDGLEGNTGAHGSLMQRYRGAGAAPEARGTDGPPLPPPRPADESEGSSTGQQGWSKAARSWSLGDTPTAPPLAPAASTPTTTPTPPSTAGSPPSTAPTGAPVLGSPPPRPSTPSTPAPPPAGAVTVTRGGSPGSSSPAPSQGVTVTRGTTPGIPAPAAAAASSAASSGPATLGADQADEFKRRWREVQGDFVDDPQLAVRGAEALAREILDALATRIADKQRVDAWQAGAGAPTEDLRLALRAYRTLVDRLIEL